MTYEKLVSTYRGKKDSFYRHPESASLEPFRIAGPIYYVGDRQVCVHLIDTGDGLILIDAGFPHTVFMLVDSIWRLGFRPEDVRAILHTHGHYDHYGASQNFQRLYGTKLYISRVDGELMRSNPFFDAADYCAEYFPKFEQPDFDYFMEDGEVLSFGNVSIRCELYPGHTPGNMGFIFDIEENGEKLTAGTFGGVGLGSARRCAAVKCGLDPRHGRAMLDSVKKARAENIDITLGNHPYNNHTLEKRAEQLEKGGNPFIDRAAWTELLDKTEKDFGKMLAEDNDE